MNKPYPFTEEQEAWLRDLETTDAPQTKNYLQVLKPIDGNPVGFCCLGRACVVLRIRHKKKGSVMEFSGKNGSLPERVMDRLRLRNPAGELKDPVEIDGYEARWLTCLNDFGWPFKQIAAYIRANPWNVFKDPEASE